MTTTKQAAEGLRDWLLDRAEKLEAEGFPNGAEGSRVWAEAVDTLLTVYAKATGEAP